MKKSLCTLAIILPCLSWGLVLHEADNTTLRAFGDKVYIETKDRIEVPDEDVDSAPRYHMGKNPIPVTMSDVIRIADEYFQKTLGLPFSEESGFVDVNLSWTGGLSDPLWWYQVTLRPYDKHKLKEPDRWDYQLAILMNGKVYPATSTRKEVKGPDPLKESGIPFLQNHKRDELHPLEKELYRLGRLPDLKADQHAGVYLHGTGSSAYIFYPDGHLFSIHTVNQGLYKVDEKGRVFTTYVYGPRNDKLGIESYLGMFGGGKFVSDQGDYQEIYQLKEKMPVQPPKPKESKKTGPKR